MADDNDERDDIEWEALYITNAVEMIMWVTRELDEATVRELNEVRGE
jgi:hypothetical protein